MLVELKSLPIDFREVKKILFFLYLIGKQLGTSWSIFFFQFNRVWELPERLCDFWVASDCMACTASILNLVRTHFVKKPQRQFDFFGSFRLRLQLIGKNFWRSNPLVLFSFSNTSYIAVTKPLKYARHKNPKRVAIMIVIVWLVSFFIALPIVR